MKNWKKLSLWILATVTVGVLANRVEFSMLKAQAEERYADLQNFTKVLNLVQQ